MKFTELRGRAVVNIEDARKIGTVEDLMVEPASHHITSVKVKTGMFHSAQIIPVADVKNVGGDAVTISSSASSNIAGTALSAAGRAEATSQSSNTESTTTTSTATMNTAGSGASADSQPPIEVTSLLGNKVVTDAGTMVGELSDVMVDWVDLTITGYEVRTGGVFTKAQEFVDAPGVFYGDKLITLPAELLNHPK